MSGTVVLKCSCEHQQQDELHGKGNRVANHFIKNGGGYRCTVCSRLHADRYATVATAKKVKK